MNQTSRTALSATILNVVITAALAVASPPVHAGEVIAIDPILVTGEAAPDEGTASSLGGAVRRAAQLAPQKTTGGDSARLLQDVPGVSLYGAGGISSLPALHGLADDRIRVQVDGTELTTACPNHMNSPLSYVDPSKVAEITVYSGVTPVSVGGDSIGGSIQVTSAPPEFAAPDARPIVHGHAGTFFRSNGSAVGYNVGASVAGSWLSLSYAESGSGAGNYHAARAFKAVAPGREGGPPIPGDEVASSAYRGAVNRELELALRRGGHTLQLALSRQTVGFEGYPNQRMDMTDNDNRLASLRYRGLFDWGDLEARFSYQDTRHEMDMGPDRFFYGTGMPMDTKARTRSALLQGNLFLSDRDTLRVGAEYQYYTLFDWWPPVGGTMGPNEFWNIDFGQRERIDLFTEWETRWSPAWTVQAGVRLDTVTTDAGPVQGYDNSLHASWGNDAAAFNAAGRRHTDLNWDLTALVRHTPSPAWTWEGGFSRKSRAPSLYQRYPWSTNVMAALMNNTAGDGNGYIGTTGLRPETAHTVSLTGDWHDPDGDRWGVKATGYYTHVQDYIDARRCDFGQCGADNVTATTGFVLLQYVNHDAQLYGADLSAHLLLASSDRLGSLTGTGMLNYVRGDNLTTGDGLYNIMPLNGKLAAVHRLAGWTGTAELLGVAGKRHLSQVRNEMATGGYWLLNLRGSYEWRHARLDLGLDNVLDRFYYSPLGGAYVGQGSSMTTTGIPWGTPVPGMGRSVSVALNLKF